MSAFALANISIVGHVENTELCPVPFIIFFQIMIIMNFSIIRYLKTFEMRTSGLYDNHDIVWGSHFRYHERDFLPKWRLCKHRQKPRSAAKVGTRWRGRSREKQENPRKAREELILGNLIQFFILLFF